jgi:hypothetical protein
MWFNFCFFVMVENLKHDNMMFIPNKGVRAENIMHFELKVLNM